MVKIKRVWLGLLLACALALPVAATQIRNSPTAGNVPATLLPGEIGINEGDSRLFYRSPGGTVSSFPLATGISGRRNRLINGGFSVNQRGYTSGTALASGVYGFDRWKAGSGGGTATFTAALPDTVVTITAGTFAQPIEAGNVEGGAYTLSWTGTSTCRVYQGTATGSYAAAPLAVSGLAAGTVTTVECGTGTLGQVQLEPGPAATMFERRPVSDQVALCQRYYQTVAFRSVLGYAAAAGGLVLADFTLPVVMRITPAVTYTSPAYTNASGIATNYVDNQQIIVTITSVAAGVAYVHAGLTLSAEL